MRIRRARSIVCSGASRSPAAPGPAPTTSSTPAASTTFANGCVATGEREGVEVPGVRLAAIAQARSTRPGRCSRRDSHDLFQDEAGDHRPRSRPRDRAAQEPAGRRDARESACLHGRACADEKRLEQTVENWKSGKVEEWKKRKWKS